MLGRQPPPARRSLSASALHRDRILANDKFWKNQKRLSPEEERALEDRWDGRHQLHFSKNNEILTPGLRDYFDRGRELPSEESFWVRSQTPVRPTYLLSHDPRHEDPDGSARFRTRPHLATSPFRPRPPRPVLRRLEDSWNGRHHVTTSLWNDLYHENSREYFSRNVAPRSERVLQQRLNGITLHVNPHKHPDCENGCDDPPTAAEALIGVSRDGTDEPRRP
uniref:Uncharacterized protein n=1 Tax=Alexandrium monilatum TaxID=311494 RepID=A0A7S4UXN6_9DINO|mmetsp:Transcript_40729/g.121734  ORF Transcript_40729/g.121734 Transcript_40729/m.121734 type:complete len:222 (+) Transcript_40729:94-759(+)